MNCWSITQKGERCKRGALEGGFFCKIHVNNSITDMYWMFLLKRGWPRISDTYSVIKFLDLFESLAPVFIDLGIQKTTHHIHNILLDALPHAHSQDQLEVLGGYRLKYFHLDTPFYYTGELQGYPKEGPCVDCGNQVDLLLLCCRNFMCRECLCKRYECHCKAPFI